MLVKAPDKIAGTMHIGSETLPKAPPAKKPSGVQLLLAETVQHFGTSDKGSSHSVAESFSVSLSAKSKERAKVSLDTHKTVYSVDTIKEADTPADSPMLKPPPFGGFALQRAPQIQANQLSTLDDGYDSDTMQKIHADTQKQIDSLKKVCFKQIEERIIESGQNLDKRIE